MDWSILNAEQKQAAICTKGAVLVTAGAGSGKTRLLTYRIAYIIEQGVSPYNILAITFTNKAANEMRERLSKIVGDIKYMWVMTFHALCARILRENIQKLDGYNGNFSIYDDNEQNKIIKNILKERDIDADKYFKPIKYLISESKSNGLTLEDIAVEYANVKNIDLIVRVYEAYEGELKKNNALDFDDLLLKTRQLLKSNPDVCGHYADRFEYISVDEFQDTNKIQYELVKMLGSRHKNIFIVGDEDQSIYGWRGANIGNIKNFIEEFKATTFKLEQNYRSTKKILKAANNLIVKNSGRIPKTLWTDNEDGVKLEKYIAYNEGEEAEYVVATAKSLVDYAGYKYSDIVVLVRLNALTRNLEEKFMNYNIPYELFGGFKFFERKEIRDIIAYMTIIANPFDNNAILRVINFPRRGIGENSIKQLTEYCAYNNVNIIDVLANIEKHYLNKPLSLKLKPFCDIICDITEYYRQNGLQKTAEYIVERTGIWELYSEENEENYNRKLNINELLSSVAKFVEDNGNDNINDYLASISLVSDIDSFNESGNKITIATIHSVKGLEFPVVFITGLEEGIFPIMRAGNFNDVEEERRLMYVAMTRSKQRLYLTHCRHRYLYGKTADYFQSRFWDEMENTEEKRVPIKKNFEEQVIKSFSFNDRFGEHSNEKEKYIPKSKPQPSKIQSLSVNDKLKEVGTKVKHKIYGIGRIINVSGSDNFTLVKVEFEQAGIKNLTLAFAPLEIVE